MYLTQNFNKSFVVTLVDDNGLTKFFKASEIYLRFFIFAEFLDIARAV